MNSWKNIGIILGLIAMMVLAYPPIGSTEDGKNIDSNPRYSPCSPFLIFPTPAIGV